MPYLQINIYFMIIIYLVELTTTDTLDALRHIHTLTAAPAPQTESNANQTQTERFSPIPISMEEQFPNMCINVCTVYTIIKGKCDNISVRSRKYFIYINFYSKQFEIRSNLLLMCVCDCVCAFSYRFTLAIDVHAKKETQIKQRIIHTTHRQTMCPNVVLISCWQKQIIGMYS